MALSAGAIYGICVLVIFVPIAVAGVVWFWLRRDIQPIKARSPELVVITDIILIMYIVILSVQRFVADDYPCMLNVWGSYIGTLVLLNAYLWRCWTLYFNFYQTQAKLENKGLSSLPPLLRKKTYIRGEFSMKFLGTLTCLLMLPCGLLVATNENLFGQIGQTCDKDSLDFLLAAYVIAYIALLIFFAFTLRAVVDNFMIKTELKLTGIVGILAFVPWAVFNNFAKSINDDVFPFSTMFLTLAVMGALCLSTFMPLYRSLYQSPTLELDVIPGDYSTLNGLLRTREGLESFKQFLTKEFSVENIMFWVDVHEARAEVKGVLHSGEEKARVALLANIKALYDKYIDSQSPFQVNLPDNIVKTLNQNFKAYTMSNGDMKLLVYRVMSIDIRRSSTTSVPDCKELTSEDDPVVTATPTIFDDAQRNIFKLMQTDSFPRYIRSDLYKKLVEEQNEKQHKAQVLRASGLA